MRFLLILSMLACPSAAVAGDVDVDAIGHFDKEGPAGLPMRTIGAGVHFDIAPIEWSACRAAAVAGLPAFDAWFAASEKPAPVKAFYASLSPAYREAVRQGALGLAQ
jgi:hypothetical protein